MKYNWQQDDWPHFPYQPDQFTEELFEFAHLTGHLQGLRKGLPAELDTDAQVERLILESLKTSEIEGEYLERSDVMSSIRNQLGLNEVPEEVRDHRARGITELLLSVRKTLADPLDTEILFHWHQLLMSGNPSIRSGCWRDHPDPMQVVSGPMHKLKIHFVAPPSERVAEEMTRFIHWFNNATHPGKDTWRLAPVHSAMAHLYFESIHPFEDGNGRIGRALADKALSRILGYPLLISLSQQLDNNRKDYYRNLERAQAGEDVTPWICWFIRQVIEALQESSRTINFTLKKAKFFDHFKDQLQDRQLKVIRRMLAMGHQGFTGGMNARKYTAIASVSKATATRDLQQLEKIGVLIRIGGGRSTRYDLNLDLK